MIPRQLTVAALSLWLAGCGHTPKGPASPAEREAASARAREAVEKLRTGLGRELAAALKKGGPPAAIAVCAERAPAIAAELGDPTLRIGRTSHKLRNPRNAPPSWVAPLLAEYEKNPALTASERLIGPGRIGYLEPIRTAAPCLACHGQALDASVEEALAKRYPNDRATGFAAGDLRGLFWVEVDLPRRR